MSYLPSENELRAYFSAHKEEMLSDLFSLVRIPSVRAEGVEGMPFGKECYKALVCARLLFEREGFQTREGGDGSYALAFLGEENIGESVGIFTHTDVVPAADGWLYTEPFLPVLRDGCAIGRGIEDNKAGVILALWTLKYLKEKEIALHRPLTVFLGAAEESGMEDLLAFKKENDMPAISLVPDSGYPVCYGEKGIARAHMTAKKSFRDVLALTGGEAFNVVLDRAQMTLRYDEALFASLSSLTAASSRVAVQKTDDGILLCATGVAAHASTPEGSVNAARVLFSLLSGCEALSLSDREILSSAASILSTTNGSSAALDLPEKDFSPLTMTNGIVALVDGKLTFSLDIRYGTAVTAEALEDKLSACAEKNGFSLSIHENKRGFLQPKDGAVVEQILAACTSYSGVRPEPFTMGGGTYCRYLDNAYSVGTFVPYIPDPFAAPKGHGGAHQADEHLPVDAFLENAALFTDILIRLSDI